MTARMKCNLMPRHVGPPWGLYSYCFPFALFVIIRRHRKCNLEWRGNQSNTQSGLKPLLTSLSALSTWFCVDTVIRIPEGVRMCFWRKLIKYESVSDEHNVKALETKVMRLTFAGAFPLTSSSATGGISSLSSQVFPSLKVSNFPLRLRLLRGCSLLKAIVANEFSTYNAINLANTGKDKYRLLDTASSDTTNLRYTIHLCENYIRCHA